MMTASVITPQVYRSTTLFGNYYIYICNYVDRLQGDQLLLGSADSLHICVLSA